MLSDLRLLSQLFLKYCYYIFLMYRLIRKRPRTLSRLPIPGVAASPHPLPLGEAGDSAVEGASLVTLRSV